MEKLNEFQRKQIFACEAFIRRAVEIDMPFMLKGSYITRQYFDSINDRIPNDLDFVYLHFLNNEQIAEKEFTNWTTLVTELSLDDNVKFNSFQENLFWRCIDYAMSDDFPTTNTDLIAVVEGEEIDISLDISFNLEIDQEPIPLLYTPLEGEPFIIPNTPPLALQVAWKLHQCLVRPRFKDMFDLIYLLNHKDFGASSHNVYYALQTLVNECDRDKVDVQKLAFLINGDLEKLYIGIKYGGKLNLAKEWKQWRFETDYGDSLSEITSNHHISENVFEFADMLKKAFFKAGFMVETLKKLPKPKK